MDNRLVTLRNRLAAELNVPPAAVRLEPRGIRKFEVVLPPGSNLDPLRSFIVATKLAGEVFAGNAWCCGIRMRP